MSNRDDTSIGGRDDRFPITRWSAVEASRSSDPVERNRAFEVIVASYWKPVYKYIRIKWNKSNEDAKDLTQGFFTRVIEKSFFDSYDPAKSRFRTFLRVCLEGYLSNEEKAARRLKRGGDTTSIPLDFENAEGELKSMPIPDPDSMDDYFDREWTRSLFELALDTLGRQCNTNGKEQHFRLFERYYLDESTDGEKLGYRELASEFGLPVTSVNNYLALARREFRRILLEKLRELCAGEDEYRREARSLLGVDVE